MEEKLFFEMLLKKLNIICKDENLFSERDENGLPYSHGGKFNFFIEEGDSRITYGVTYSQDGKYRNVCESSIAKQDYNEDSIWFMLSFHLLYLMNFGLESIEKGEVRPGHLGVYGFKWKEKLTEIKNRNKA